MGKQADVEARWPDGVAERGLLQYEPPRLTFRGERRHVFEAADLADVIAEGAELALRGGVRFRLPTPAQGWADAILRPRGRLDKLRVKPGLRIAVANLDDPAFAAELAGVCPPTDELGALDRLFYGADTAGELARIGELVDALGPKGALWIVSLKGRELKLKDVEVMAAARPFGLVDIKVCAFSERRTALKFVRRRSR
jgi:hypothetical protein